MRTETEINFEKRHLRKVYFALCTEGAQYNEESGRYVKYLGRIALPSPNSWQALRSSATIVACGARPRPLYGALSYRACGLRHINA